MYGVRVEVCILLLIPPVAASAQESRHSLVNQLVHPVSTSLKYFHEFKAENRLEGDSGFLTVTTPLSVGGH